MLNSKSGNHLVDGDDDYDLDAFNGDVEYCAWGHRMIFRDGEWECPVCFHLENDMDEKRMEDG